MATRQSAEYLAFQKCYDLLKGTRHGIQSILDKAFAANLITSELINKCLDEPIEKKTLHLLAAIKDRIEVKRETFHKFVKILEEENGITHLGDELLKKLEEEKRFLAYKNSSFPSYLIPVQPSIPSNSNMIYRATAIERKASLSKKFSSLELINHIPPFNDQAGYTSSITPPPKATNMIPGIKQIAKTPPPECNFSMVISPLPPLPNHQQEPAHQADKTKRIPPGHGVQSEQRAQPDHRAQPERPAQPAHRAQLDNVQMKERSESLSTNYGNEEITVSKQAPTPIDWGEDLSLHQQNNQLKMENGCLKASEGVRKEERRSSGSRLLLSLSSTDSEVYFTPPTSLEETEKAKSTCKQCIELKRCLSKSEEEVKKLKKKLTTHDYASDNQMTQLKDELLEKEQENSMLNERFQTYHSQSAYYIKQLHIKIQHLELALDTKVIEKNEALKRLDELQQTINQGYSLSCSPHIHLHMHTSPSGVPLSYPSNTSPPSNMFYHHTRWPPQDSVSGTMNPRAWRSYPMTPNVPLHGPSHTMGIHTTQITPEYTVDTMYLNSQTTSLDYNMDRNSRLQEQVLDHNWTLAGSDQGLGHDTRPASYNPAGGLGHDTKPASYNPAGGLGHDTRPASYDPAGGLGHYTRPANYNPAGGLTHDTRTKATLASYDPVGSVQGLGHNSRIQATFMDMGQCIGADLPDGHIGADSPDGHCNSQYLNDTKTQQDVGQISQVNSPQQDPSYYYGSQNNDSIDTFDNMTADSPPFRGPSNDSGYESLLTTSLSHDSIDYTPKARPNVLKMRNNVCETSQ